MLKLGARSPDGTSFGEIRETLRLHKFPTRETLTPSRWQLYRVLLCNPAALGTARAGEHFCIGWDAGVL
jgi:hypothetical protein